MTANWWRGAVYGAVLGLLFYAVSGGGSAETAKSSANVQGIDEDQFEVEVMRASTPVVVDFYATWCGPCKQLAPVLDDLAGPLTNRVKFVKVDVDKAPGLARRFDVQGVPTLVFFSNGQVVERIAGLPPTRDALKERIDKLALSDQPQELGAAKPQPKK